MITLSVGDIVRLTSQKSKTNENEINNDSVCMSPSTYHYGFSLQFNVDPIKDYVICGIQGNGYILAVHNNHELSVGFGLFQHEDGSFYTRITQVGYKSEPVIVDVVGKELFENVPNNKHFIGSSLFVAYAV